METFLEQKCSNLRPLLSITRPQGFQISKKFGHWTFGSGGNKTAKRSEKQQTHKEPFGYFELEKESAQRAGS